MGISEQLWGNKGDLLVGTASGIETLAAGSAGQVLTVGGSDPSGLEWSNAGAALTNVTSFITSDVSLSAGTAKTITSASLAAGTWLVIGQANYDNSSATTSSDFEAWLSTTNNGGGSSSLGGAATYVPDSTASDNDNSVCFSCIVTPSVTTTYYLVGEAAQAGTVLHNGNYATAAVMSGIVAIKIG